MEHLIDRALKLIADLVAIARKITEYTAQALALISDIVATIREIAQAVAYARANPMNLQSID